MIATLTINPAIDKSTTLDRMLPEKKLRCSDLRIEAGGGGINVSKAIQKLGGESLAMFPSGGANGKLLVKILLESKIPFKSIPVENETRESFTATELSTNAQYRFVMPGCALSSTEIDCCLSAITALNPLPSIIIASGSLPPSTPDDIFAQFAVISKKLGIKLIVDTSGRPLHLAVQEGVYLLKPNLSELCSLANKQYLQMSEVDEVAKDIIKNGHCEVMVVSMGPAGAILVTKDMHEKIPAPTVKKLSTVGAGDSMVGGMAWMLEQRRPLLEMVRFGVACGTAATMKAGTQLFETEDVYRLYEWINQHSISFYESVII